ncbi:MAG TPA: hypothetical protein VJA66_15930 [Thermoanaerobaculia bacterium]
MSDRLRLSVVMAAPAGSVEQESARVAFEAQLESAQGDELIVERGETSALLVPELWTRGILRSSGEIVALTLASMVPDPNWVKIVRGSFDGSIAGVGGAIEPADAMRSLDWAIHLTRYSGYLLPFRARDVDDLPGDNAAYRRKAIDPAREVWAGGFWETAVDRALRRSGQRLRLIPEMVVRQGRSAGARAFCRNRFRHGRYHGMEMARGRPRSARWLRTLFSPAVPFVLLLRIARRAFARGRARGFLLALPYLCLFLTAWAAGEAAGYLLGSD